MDDLVSVPDARSTVKNTVEPCPDTVKPLDECPGHVLRETVVASECHPAFRTAALDGYAIQQKDLNQTDTFERVETVAAGNDRDIQLDHGECVKISTGAPVPEDADAIIPLEDTRVEDNTVNIQTELDVKPGSHIRNPGEDIVVGDTVIDSGTVVRPYELGGALLAGYCSLTVVRFPSVACLITGDELVSDPTKTLSTGQQRDTNRITLRHLLESDGIRSETGVSVPDTPAETRRAFENAVQNNDVVISTGGVSAENRDCVKDTLVDLDARILFHGVAMEPGKPVAFAELENTYIFALPGNVASTLITYELFVRPALMKMRGLTFQGRSRFSAISDQDWPRDPNCHNVYRVSVDDRPYPKVPLVKQSRAHQGSHKITTFIDADGLLEIPPGSTIEEGEPVDVSDLRDNSFTAV